MPWTTLCNLTDLEEGQGKYVEIDGFRLAVFLHEAKVYVIDNECPHAGGSLAAGPVIDGCAVCPWHGWPFHLATGYKKGTEGFAVAAYQARIVPKGEDRKLVQANLPMP
ncbi:MAG: Rieske (2Fe-2S) protein [Planctomycetes bacterium]|nr:Rieske (2Fe-2S) protein [Planctomycetota bacterium]